MKHTIFSVNLVRAIEKSPRSGQDAIWAADQIADAREWLVDGWLSFSNIACNDREAYGDIVHSLWFIRDSL